MLKDLDEYTLTGSINCKLLLKWDLFHWEKYRLCKLLLNPRKMHLTMLFTFYMFEQLTYIKWYTWTNYRTYFWHSSVKTDSSIVIVSNSAPRGDKNKEKAEKVIKVINNACVQRHISVMNNANVNWKSYLSRIKLHSNGYRKP